MKTRTKVVGALLMSAMMMLPACAVYAEEVKPVTIVNLYGLSPLDPHDGWNGWYSCRLGISECLVTIDENITLQPQLSDSWERVDDLTWKFHIRQGVKFSNGNDMTAESVKSSFERLLSMSSRLASLKIDTVAVDGEYVIFTTTEPYSAFANALTEPMCSIVDTSVDMTEFNAMPICTGPYKVIEYVADERVELEANEYYWNGVPEVTRLTALHVGEDTKVDAMLAEQVEVGQGADAITLSKLEGADQIAVIKTMGTRVGLLAYNCAEDHATSDLNLRMALSYALNRDIIAQIDGNGYTVPATTLFASSYGTGEIEVPDYDPEKAKEYLAKAGYEDTDGNGYVEKDGEELVLDMPFDSKETSVVVQAMQDMWKAVGVHVEIRLVEDRTTDRDEGNYDLYETYYQTLNAGDGQTFLRNNFGSEAAIGYVNSTRYESARMDELLSKLDSTDDPEERVNLFMEAQQILADEMPWDFLFSRENVYMVNTNVIDPDSVIVHPIDYYFVTNTWKMAE